MIVVDTNLILALSTKTPDSALALAVQTKDEHWIAPPLWESEFRNVMLKLIRAGAMGHNTALEAHRLALENVQTVQVSTATVLRLTEIHGLSAYDAEFASLAEWQDIRCVSFDDDLLKVGVAIHPRDF